MLESPLVCRLIDLALQEDLALGDITSELTIPLTHRSKACVLARRKLVVCGLGLIPLILQRLKSKTECTLSSADGQWAKEGEILAVLEGPTRELLAAERTILNFLQHLSAVATRTKETVARAGEITILDTRKTTPGWRVLEKYAVRTGGGKNHRFSLGDMILVKNNHIDAQGGDMAKTLSRIQKERPSYMPVEVEVRSLAELKTALTFTPDVVMLDNMDDPMIRQALKIVSALSRPPLVEVSGGISPERLTRLEKLGVRYVSMGSLTSQAGAVDISMRISALQKPRKRSKK